jgi:hypothetical protein
VDHSEREFVEMNRVTWAAEMDVRCAESGNYELGTGNWKLAPEARGVSNGRAGTRSVPHFSPCGSGPPHGDACPYAQIGVADRAAECPHAPGKMNRVHRLTLCAGDG